MTANAIRIEKVALGRIGDHIENFLCFVCRRGRVDEKTRCRDAGALGNLQADGRYCSALASDRVEIVCLRNWNNPWICSDWLQHLRELLAIQSGTVYRNESTV